MTDFLKTLSISAAGMKAQGERIRVISENLANANSLGRTPEDDPYRRKVVTFRNVLDRDIGVERVQLGRVKHDTSEFGLRYEPGHPAANDDGYVRTPNVNSLVEMMDMKEAQRSYEANLGVIEASKSMMMQTIGILQR